MPDSQGTSPLRPTEVGAVQEIVSAASSPLCIVAGGTKTMLGRAVEAGTTVDMTGLSGIVDYEPGELILVARPGTPLAEVEQLLAAQGQHLAFEPPHWGPTATLGGTVACGLSGPRRFKAGALRDFVLGVQIVNGQGGCVRAGGRVVKNVTGFDLPRVLAGSFGTLGIVTEICLKLWPKPEQEQTLVFHGQTPPVALKTLLQCARLPFEVTGLAYWPQSPGQPARTLVRVEGAEQAVVRQVTALRETAGLAGSASQVEVFVGETSAIEWSRVREYPVEFDGDGQLWRFSVPPASAGELIDALEGVHLEGYLVDWAGGLVWARLPVATAPADLHSIAVGHGGLAWRLATAADDPNRDAFTPMNPVLANLNRKLKVSMDPRGLLNPGRMAQTVSPTAAPIQ